MPVRSRKHSSTFSFRRVAKNPDARLREGVVEWVAQLSPVPVRTGLHHRAFAVSLYAPAKIVFLSKRLPRPWPDIAMLRMPGRVGILLIGAALLAFLFRSSFIGGFGTALLGALFTAFSI